MRLKFGCCPLEHGRHRATGTAPRGPDIDEQRNIASRHMPLETAFIDLDGLAREYGLMTGAAAGARRGAIGRQPIDLTAVATDDLPACAHASFSPLVALTLYTSLRIYRTMNINIKTLEAAADQAVELFKTLSNRHRLLIVCQLIDGERSVGDLAKRLGIRDSTVSQHLALLRKDGVVAARRDAQTIYYSIASAPVGELLETLYRIYCAPGPARKAKRKL